jgi:hypothetical protein
VARLKKPPIVLFDRILDAMELTRDEAGILVPQEPMYLDWSEREGAGVSKYGPKYAMPDIWKCRDHPDWQGEDVPVPVEVRGPKPPWWRDGDEESIQLHGLRHGWSVEAPR